jgi:hypothetical protein
MAHNSDRRSLALAVYQPRFKAAVLNHIQHFVDGVEWRRLRALAADSRRHVVGWEDAYAELPAEQLVDVGVSEDELSSNEVLMAWRGSRPVEIHRIDEAPLYYVAGQGIYFWGRDPIERWTLMFWITYPSYPPKW